MSDPILVALMLGELLLAAIALASILLADRRAPDAASLPVRTKRAEETHEL